MNIVNPLIPVVNETILEIDVPYFQMLTQTRLVMTVLGKNGTADLVSLSSNGTDIATHLLSNGLVEYEKQRNRNKYGTLVSPTQLYSTLKGYLLPTRCLNASSPV